MLLIMQVIIYYYGFMDSLNTTVDQSLFNRIPELENLSSPSELSHVPFSCVLKHSHLFELPNLHVIAQLSLVISSKAHLI